MTGNIIWNNFCLAGISKDFPKDEQGISSLKGAVYNSWVDYSSIKTEDILNIHQYLMIKNIIKQCLR